MLTKPTLILINSHEGELIWTKPTKMRGLGGMWGYFGKEGNKVPVKGYLNEFENTEGHV